MQSWTLRLQDHKAERRVQGSELPRGVQRDQRPSSMSRLLWLAYVSRKWKVEEFSYIDTRLGRDLVRQARRGIIMSLNAPLRVASCVQVGAFL